MSELGHFQRNWRVRTKLPFGPASSPHERERYAGPPGKVQVPDVASLIRATLATLAYLSPLAAIECTHLPESYQWLMAVRNAVGFYYYRSSSQ